MFALLASVPGKLKTLLDRLTATRAANLDKLDANITTRAAASSALSNAVWTDARAGYLDQLSVAPLKIKSIQRGAIVMTDAQTSVNATITAVNTAKSVLIHLGESNGFNARLSLVNSTTVNANKNFTNAGVTVGWQVVEFE